MRVEVSQAEVGSWRVRLRFRAERYGEFLFAQNAYLRGVVTASVFDFRPDIDYSGFLVKRGPIRQDELVWIAGGDSVEAQADLSTNYDVANRSPAGVIVRYRASHPVFGIDSEASDRANSVVHRTRADEHERLFWAISEWITLH